MSPTDLDTLVPARTAYALTAAEFQGLAAVSSTWVGSNGTLFRPLARALTARPGSNAMDAG